MERAFYLDDGWAGVRQMKAYSLGGRIAWTLNKQGRRNVYVAEGSGLNANIASQFAFAQHGRSAAAATDKSGV